MIKKYAYTVETNNERKEVWGYNSLEHLENNISYTYIPNVSEPIVSVYETTHRQYGKTLKQVECKKLN